MRRLDISPVTQTKGKASSSTLLIMAVNWETVWMRRLFVCVGPGSSGMCRTRSLYVVFD